MRRSLRLPGRRPAASRSGTIHPDMARVLQNAAVEELEAHAVVEVTQMGQLVAESVHHTGILEQAARLCVMQADANAAVRVAHPVALLHLGTLWVNRVQLKPEVGDKQARVAFEPLQNHPSLCPLCFDQAG